MSKEMINLTIEKLKSIEPLFGCWYVESKVAEGRSSKVFRVSKTENGITTNMCVKTLRFPKNNNEISKTIDSGIYSNIDEYLVSLEKTVRTNMDKMLLLNDNNNIVHVEDYGIIKENSCFYVVMLMELLTPLSDYLKADRIKPKEVIRIGWDLCNALDGFRSEGIIHRNIKPDNIYVDGNGTYKLGDFGISETGKQKFEYSGYTAPELYTEHTDSTSSDIYSLGVVLYKLLNNNRGPFLPPFPAPISLSDREQASVRRLRGDLLPKPANADHNLSKIIFKAASHKPEERYESPLLMRRDFELYLQALASAPSAATAAAVTHRVGTEAPRKPRTDGASSVTAADKNDFVEAFRDDEPEEETKPDKKWYYIIMALVVVLALVIGLVVKSVSDRNSDKDLTEETTTAVTTTEETTTEVTTTEETTAEETTEETTTEETTTEETTEETTTEVTTTQETTTEVTTTEETTLDNIETTDPILVGSLNTAGSQNDDGKYFINAENYSVNDGLDDMDDKEIVLEFSDDFGKDPQPIGDVYIYMMQGPVNIQTVTPQVSLKENDDGTYTCTVTVHDDEFFYDAENYQYFLCFEEGAIESETSLILPIQIKL